MIDPDDTGVIEQDVGRRLELTRRALGYEHQKDFAAEVDLSQPNYTVFENGKRLLTLHAAMRLCRHYGLTLDWLYFGDPSGLPYKLATEIKNLRKNNKTPKVNL